MTTIGPNEKGHTDSILCLAISNNNEWFISGSVDRTVKVRRPSSSTIVQKPRGVQPPPARR
jgi:WD40 repeat protein